MIVNGAMTGAPASAAGELEEQTTTLDIRLHHRDVRMRLTR